MPDRAKTRAAANTVHRRRIPSMSVIASVNAGARLDRLPLSAFHRRIMRLIGLGMFFDGFDIYLGAAVLGALCALDSRRWGRTPPSCPAPSWA